MRIYILKTAAILLFLAGSFYSCGKEKDVQHDIVGTWIKETTYSDGTEDTIVFTNDLRVEKYFKHYEEENYRMNYKLKADTVFISANSGDFTAKRGFKYSITGNKLIISRFTYPFSVVAVERDDVIFIRNKTN